MEPGRRRSHRLSARADPRLPQPRRAVLGAARARRAGLRGADELSQARGLPRGLAGRVRRVAAPQAAAAAEVRRAHVRRRLSVVPRVRLSRLEEARLPGHALRVHRLRRCQPQRAVVGAAQGSRRRGLRRAGAQQDAWRPAACARRDRRAVRQAHAGRARGATAAVPAPARPGRAVPRLPLWPRRRRPAHPRARAGLRRRLHRAPREQSLVRATAAHQPQPDLLGDDARAIRAEPEPVPPRNPAMRHVIVLVAALMLGACVTVPTKSELIRPARARAKALEREGQLRPALVEWKVARAIDPDDAEARANEARLTSRTAVAVLPRGDRPAPSQGEQPAPSQGERPTPSQDEPPEVNPLLADVRDAVERKEFATALADLDRYLADNPRDREGTELKKLALYRQGQSALDEKKYDDSYRALTLLARLQPDYQDVARLLPQARRQVIDRHYQEGIRFFREEKLPEAIAEWKVVLDMEPQHVNARRNIEQAERLMKGLEQRRSR